MRISIASWPGGAADNEDFVAASSDTVAGVGRWRSRRGSDVVVVLDGVTPVDRSDIGCRHGVAWYAGSLGVQLLAAARDTSRTLADCLAEAIRRTAAGHPECDGEHPDSPAATVAACRVRPDALEYLVLADTTLLLADVDGSVRELSDGRAADVGRRMPPVGAADGPVDGAERARLVRSWRNRPGGYYVAAGDPAVAAEALTGVEPLDRLSDVVLASDGAARPVEVFGAFAWKDVLSLIRTEGASGWLRRTRDLEASDPHCERWRRGKARDDATLAHLAW